MLNFRDYLIFAEKYVSLAESKGKSSTNIEWLLIPSVILSWTAIESFVNNRLFDYRSLPENKFALHERAFLLEQKIKFVDSGDKIGSFRLEGSDYRRLEDKIFFLISKFGSKEEKNLKGGSLWQKFRELKALRDNILHPRTDKDIDIDIDLVIKHINTSKCTIQLISEHIWGKKVVF